MIVAVNDAYNVESECFTQGITVNCANVDIGYGFRSKIARGNVNPINVEWGLVTRRIANCRAMSGLNPCTGGVVDLAIGTGSSRPIK